MTLIRRVISPR